MDSSSALRVTLLTQRPRCAGGSGLGAARRVQPDAQQREQLLGVDRLGDVVGRAGLDALLAVALHRLGGERDDRQVREPLACSRMARIVS